jgi:chromosome segregation ATPase
MATQKDVQIYFKVDGLEQYITSLEELDQVLKQVNGSTDQVSAAQQQLDQATNDIVSSTEKFETRLNTMEGATKVLAGSFEALAGAASLAGLEDNEFFKELGENVVGVLALSRGAIDAAEGVRLLAQNQKLATAAQAAFNFVANLNPYVLLATAILAAGAALIAFSGDSEEAEEQAKDLNTELEKQIARFDQYNSKIDGEINARRRLLEAKNGEVKLDEEIGFLKEKIALRQEDIVALEQKEREIISQGVTPEEKERLTQVKEALEVKRSQVRTLNLEIEIAKEEDARKKREKRDADAKEKKAKEDAKKAAEAVAEANRKAAEEAAREAAIKLNLKQIDEARAQVLDEQGELEEELYRAGLSARELAFRDLEDDYYRRINLANGNAELLLKIDEQYKLDKKSLDDQFNADQITGINDFNSQVVQAEQELFDAKYGIAKAGVELFTALAGQNEKAANIAFVIEKALAVGEVVVNLQRELAANRANPTWKLLPDGGATLVAAANAKARISAGISIASIVATSIAKFKSGGATPPAGNDNVSPGGALGIPQINYNFAQNSGQVLTPGGVQSEPVRAYVLVSDVNSAQQANNQIERYSRL